MFLDMQSQATRVEDYLESLPADRRQAIEAVRTVIRKNLHPDYEEGMQYGMIGYYVPHRVYPNGYHCDPKQPLPFAALASQKNYRSVYLMSLYYGSGGAHGSEHLQWFREEWKKSGKKLNMGKVCIRFQKAEDLALDVIGKTIGRVPPKKFIALYEDGLALTRKKAKPAAKKK